ncbi:uncharacterized protein Dwil_GK10295 [Drosophila willistoni]|uniref:Insulin-like domain-containing protein n=1 Tax=Drosophila willistoni TaxID=7260 RepID=B4MJ58_DROWI|nr:uncharacterized protein LOC6638043 [Drosophila willistoni]EDW72147.2 uncharacterized protein Dwil_GK10295 [Drosophila willistoni]
MIFVLPLSLRIALLVVFFTHIMALVNASPLTSLPPEEERMIRCSDVLAESIQLICKGRTNSLADLYPRSVGQRVKRLSNNQQASSGGFYRILQSGAIHECCRHPCGHSEIKRYCAPD